MFFRCLIGLLVVCTLSGVLYATDVIVQQKRVIFDANYFVGSDGYYQVGEKIKQEKSTQLDSDKLDKIIDLLSQLVNGKVSPPTDPVTPTDPIDIPKLDDLTTTAHKILKAKCYNCHKAGTSNGFTIFDKDDNVNLSLAQIVNVHYRTEGIGFEPGTVLMPKGGQPLNADEMVTLKKWLKLEADKAK